MSLGNITQSEWEILKVLWDENNLTNGQIIKEVNKDNDWAKTTINSFIQRLIEKGYINYHHNHRYREYYATLTEKECVTMKMRELTKSIYGKKMISETNYFEFYGYENPEMLNILTYYADNGYERITSILKYKFDDKLSVHIHKTQKRFHSVMGNPNGPKWHRASFIWGMLHLSPLDCFDDITVDKAMMHVFTQLTVSQINENCPYYLNQGISAYLAKWLDNERIIPALQAHKNDISLNYLRSFVFDLENFRSSAGYELSYAFVSYIVSKFGSDSLRLMINNPYDLPSLFNIEESRLIQEFRKYINDNYLLLKGNTDE